jgi:hypothetical protein
MTIARGARLFVRLFLIAAVSLELKSASARAANFTDSFEGPNVAWRIASADARYRVVGHRIVARPAHHGAGCEELQLVGQGGSFVHAVYEVGRAPVIDELKVALWVRADRPGLQMAVRVVLPHTIDPRTNSPVTLLIYGDIYNKSGVWQQLTLDRLPPRVSRQIRVAQSGFEKTIDGRQAFIAQLVLNVYGGTGTTTVWIDRLQIDGLAGRIQTTDPDGSPVRQAVFDAPPVPERSAPSPRIRVNASVISVAGSPVFPRIVEHQGESFAFLQSLGFNVIWLQRLPTVEQRFNAARLGLGLICPPPDLHVGARIDSTFDRVLAWDIGSSLSRRELAVTTKAIQLLRLADQEVHRPIVCNPVNEIRAYSRQVDVLLHRRQPLRSTLEMSDYKSLLKDFGLHARADMPIWTTLPTDEPQAWRAQIAAAGADAESARLDFTQLRYLANAAVAAGARGMLFESATRLDADTDAARYRAKLLNLINLELQLLDPWTSAGRAATPGRSSDSSVETVVIQANRSRILMRTRFGGGAQYVEAAANNRPISFIVPGVASTNQAYQLSTLGLNKLSSRRVAGGLSVSVRDPLEGSVVLMTDDSRWISDLSRRVAETSAHAARLEYELVADQFERVGSVIEQLAEQAAPMDEAKKQHTRAGGLLAIGRQHLASIPNQAMIDVRRVSSQLTGIKRETWSQAIRQFGPPEQFPMLASFYTLPLASRWLTAVKTRPRSPNLVYGGEMENLEQMLTAGWRHTRREQPQFAADVELSTQGPHSGRASLRLRVAPLDPRTAPKTIESALHWVTTPTVLVRRGQLIEARGWVKISDALQGTIDGLTIFDSHAGPAMAHRIAKTAGWEPFVLYRAATHDGPLHLSFAMAGVGAAQIDDVSIRVIADGYNVGGQAFAPRATMNR